MGPFLALITPAGGTHPEHRPPGIWPRFGVPMHPIGRPPKAAPHSASEHGLTDFFAAMLGGTAWYGEGYENAHAQERDDYIIMPSGYAIPTDYCKYYFSNAYQWAPAGMSSTEYLLRNCAYGEQWVIDSDGNSYDPRSNKVDQLSDGGTGQPSPTLYPYYSA